MFSTDNIILLLQAATEFSVSQQQRLIIPGIIFSVGAIMLILCVLVSNIQRKKKLADAERMKRERIKKFSEEANMRYNVPNVDTPLRQRKIVTEDVVPNGGRISPVQSSAPVMPNTNQAVPIMPGVMQQASMPNATPQMPSQMTMPQQPMSNPSSTPMPGMNNGYIPDTKINVQNENIVESVRQKIKEIEEKTRNEIAAQNAQNDAAKTIAPTPSLPTSSVTPQMPVGSAPIMPAPVAKETQSEEIKNEIKEENKTEEKTEEKTQVKKEFKFEYKPDYKPGQEPKEETKIEIPLKKEDTEEEKAEEIKEEIKEEKVEEQKTVDNVDNSKENKEEKVHLSTTIKTISLDENDNAEKETEEKIDDTKPEPVSKVAKVILERSTEFIEAENKEEEKAIVESEEEVKKQIERIPQVPKITSKKIDYNVGFLREVQSKLDASREYEEAIALKQDAKDKLKEELLEKRMHLEKVKTKLQDEIEKKEESRKLTKEEISKSLLDNTEKGIVYEEGKKVSLFDTPVNEESKPQEKIEVKKEIKPEVKEEPKEEKIEIKHDDKKENVTDKVLKRLNDEKIENENKQKELERERIEKEKEAEAKKQSEVFSQLDALFSAQDDDNESKDSNLTSRLKEKISRDSQKNKLKEIVKESKKEDIVETQTKSTLESDIEKVKANMAALAAGSIAAKKVNDSLNKIEVNDFKSETKVEKEIQKPQEQVETPAQNQIPIDGDDDPIRARIRAKVEEEKKKKEELLRQEQEAKEEKNKEKQKTKSILNGVDIEQEILQNKANKKVTSFSDAPDYKKIIAVVSPEGCGKTTIATNLAYELANRGLKVCLIDTDNIKKDIYYYINEEQVGCLSKLNEFDDAEDMYNLGIKVNDRLTVFTENKGIEFEINYSKLYKLINFAQKKNDCVIIDVKQTLGQEKTKDLLKLSTNILFVIDKKITTLNRIAEKFAKVKGGFVNKDITVVVNMDEGRGINKAAVKSIFKHLEYMENGEKKSYSIKIGNIYTVAYDTKSIITGLISQLPAVTVAENRIISDMKNIASHFFETNK